MVASSRIAASGGLWCGWVYNVGRGEYVIVAVMRRRRLD